VRDLGGRVGPITITGSPFFREAIRRVDTPISRAMSESSPFSLSTHAPVSAMPSMLRRTPFTTWLSDSKFWSR
jgi:hypothetical protein